MANPSNTPTVPPVARNYASEHEWSEWEIMPIQGGTVEAAGCLRCGVVAVRFDQLWVYEFRPCEPDQRVAAQHTEEKDARA